MLERINIRQALIIKLFRNSIDRNSSKIHLAIYVLGNPIEFIVIGGGITHDVNVVHDLIDILDLKEKIADKSY